MESSKPPDPELWGEYGVGAFFILLRFYARIRLVGFTGLGLEDALMAVALSMYTAITVLIQEITQHGAIIGQTAESVELLPEVVVQSFTLGQKLVWADWLIYLVYMWCLKSTLLVMFVRLTWDLGWQRRLVHGVCAYTAVCFVGAVLTHICICLPVHRNWQIRPYPGDECAVRRLNYLIITALNASSDIAIAAAPLPVIFGARIPPLKRVLLTLLLCGGLFVAVAAILRAYYSLQDLSKLAIAAGWTSRELFVAAVVVSIPGIKPFVSRSAWFRTVSSWVGSHSGGSARGRLPLTHKLVTVGGRVVSPGGLEGGNGAGKKGWVSKSGKEAQRVSDGDSEEFILPDDDGMRGRLTREYKKT